MDLLANKNQRDMRLIWLSALPSLLIVIAFYFVANDLLSPPRAVTIALGFFTFFVIPGWVLSCILLPHSDFDILERYPLSIFLSLGVWSFPGLIAFGLEMKLEHVLLFYMSIIILLIVAVVLSGSREDKTERDKDAQKGTVIFFITALVFALGLGVLAYFLQAQRGLGLDWDFFNYISAVRKLAENALASNGHFAYKDAPIDPIHSYNIWALNWSLIAHFGKVDPVELYLNSSFLTLPAAVLSFYTFSKKILAKDAALAAFVLFVFYQVIYGGLHFLSMTTFYPADSMWLVAFPAAVSLLVYFIGQEGLKNGLVLALGVLGISIVHVLWGLAFFMSALAFLAAYLLKHSRLFSLITKGASRIRKAAWYFSIIIFTIPFIASLAWFIIMAARDNPDWHEPLVGSFTGDSLSVYALVFLAIPVLVFILSLRPLGRLAEAYQKSTYTEPPVAGRVMALIILALILSIPYIFLRWKAIQFVQWESFGVNPYQGLITENLFLLNPFQRSFTNPNMSFYPLIFLGYILLPLVFRAAGHLREGMSTTGAMIFLAVLIMVPLITLHPVLASLFANFFSLGYLRRILRLAALFSFIPISVVIARLLTPRLNLVRRPVLYLGAVLILSTILSLVSTAFPARPPYYNHLLGKILRIMTLGYRDSLLYDDAPFEFLKKSGTSKPGEVILSDPYTSFRLTAYLNNYVVFQHKPGVGVPDQDERARDQENFFSTDTSIREMRNILDKYSATVLIINRNPSYLLLNRYPCGHPETIGKLKNDPEHFDKIFDQGDWVIFRYHPHE
jgi:hypothetical protein